MMTRNIGFERLKFSLLMIVLLTGIAMAACPDGMVGYWKFDEGSGTTTADAVNNNNGAINGAIWTSSGKFSNALDFDGTGNYVSINADPIGGQPEFTIEAWIYPYSVTSATGHYFKFIVSNMKTYGSGQFYLYITNDGKIMFNTHAGTISILGNIIISPNEWTHVAVTYTANDAKLYVNGNLDGTDTDCPTTAAYSGTMLIGKNYIAGDPWAFMGVIDEFAIYDKVLTQAEIQANMNKVDLCLAGAPPLCGNEEINEDEECDPPQSVCIPAYGGLCQYCNASCKYQAVQGGYCGDGVCQEAESHSSCPGDCPLCPSGMAGYWKFDEGSGTTTVDELDLTDPGQVLFSPWTSNGKIGSGIDARYGQVDIPDSQATHVPYLTVCYWIYPYSIRDQCEGGVEKGGWASNPSNYNGFILSVGCWGADNLFFETYPEAIKITQPLLQNNRWSFICGLYGDGRYESWLDGELAFSHTSIPTKTMPYDANPSMTVGTRWYHRFDAPSLSGDTNFNGMIDELVLFDRALSPTEIQDLYDATKDGVPDSGYCERAAAPPQCTIGITNIALGKSTSSSADYPEGNAYANFKVVDGSTTNEQPGTSANFWLLPNHQTGWVQVDLGSMKQIGKVRWLNTHNAGSGDRATTDYHIALSSDGASFNTITSGSMQFSNSPSFQEYVLPAPTDARYVRFYADGYYDWGGGLNELEVYDCVGASPPETICNNNVDDDEDGLTDCADTDCASDPACQAPPNLIYDSTGGTVAEQGITVTVPPGALPTTELLVTIVQSTHSFAPVAGTTVIGQPLDIGPQCADIASQSTCESTNGCQWNGACSFIPFESPVTITMPGDCSGTKKIYQEKIAKYVGTSWVPVVTCTPVNRGGGFYSCISSDGRLATWNQTSCMMSVQTLTFSSYAVTEYGVQYCSTQFISQEGIWTVDYDVTDTYGNRVTGASQEIKVDLYPPSTLPQLTGVMGGMGWYTSDVVVDFASSDSMSGVKAVYYSLDNETWNEWAGPDTLVLLGASKLYYYTKDRAGHTSDVQSIDVNIEKTAPTINIEELGTSGTAPWWMSALGLSITATDTESGVKTICYTIGGVEDCVQAPQEQ